MKDSTVPRQIHVVCGVFFRQSGDAVGVVADGSSKFEPQVLVSNSEFEVALFRRNDQFKFFEFPGGKVDPGETEHQALIRELKEELNLDVEILGFLGENTHDYVQTKTRVVLRAFWVRTDDWSNLQLVDHSDWRWAGQSQGQNLSAADIPLWDLIFDHGARP